MRQRWRQAPKAAAAAPRRLILILVPLLIITAGAGFFWPEIYEGLVPPHTIAESQGQDLVTLFAAVPLLLLSLAWLRRGLLRGTMVAAGALAYTAYVSIIYAYGGVANLLYFGYIACLGLSVSALALLWGRLNLRGLRFLELKISLRRTVAIFHWALSALLVLVWGGMGAAAITAGAPSEANTILVTNLAFVIPAFVLAGIWLWRGEPRGAVLAGATLTLNVVLNGSIIAGQIMRLQRGLEPSWGLAGLFGAVAIIALALSIAFFSGSTRRRLPPKSEELIPPR